MLYLTIAFALGLAAGIIATLGVLAWAAYDAAPRIDDAAQKERRHFYAQLYDGA